MIRVVPAMAIKEGQVVKTIRGNVDEVQVYDKNPLDLAMEFEDNGIKRLHLIDIDGASKRKVVNYPTLEMIAKYTKLEIDFTGGITSDGDVRTAFEFGASFITVASVPMHEPEKFNSWLVTYGNKKIILAADALHGVVRTGGWKKHTGVALEEHISHYYERGIRRVKCTEISRDGTLEGPALEVYQALLVRFPDLKILASGGIRSVGDIEALDSIGVTAVLVSKSFYEGRIQLKDLQKFSL
ncbi:MAG: 1-(5-phosphoribosyl)-5-[(5-phosphoribosylamino)methylideneamino] imidazole-4-carboxamide isomerase [Microscillaceae bacterium]|nr:1-(5-phosphoribosyl)-5-[(5-phosphoribosylamino)methylideneamino] imidazole-4-carboxamide isomerase [Microscillaceae bacterium]